MLLGGERYLGLAGGFPLLSRFSYRRAYRILAIGFSYKVIVDNPRHFRGLSSIVGGDQGLRTMAMRPLIGGGCPRAPCRDHRRCRRACRKRAVVPRIARRGIDSAERLGRHRWVIERTLAWFARFRRLTVRYERRLDILLALHLLAAGLVCLRFVGRWSC